MSDTITATTPEEFQPVRLMPMDEKYRADLIEDAGYENNKITNHALRFPLLPIPSQTWRTGFNSLWKREYGSNHPALSDAGISFPLGVAYLASGLSGYIAQIQNIISLTNEKYQAIYRQEMAEKAQAEAARRERQQHMINLLDSIRLSSD